jgi:hypothetical protein
VKFEIVKLEELSGERTSIYSVIVDDETKSLFDWFLAENRSAYPDEVQNIVDRIEMIGHRTGALDNFFKMDEGKPGQGIVALYDKPEGKLRLYCLCFGKWAILLGGGGPKNVATLQEDPKLKSENYLLRRISDVITQRIKDKDLWWRGNNLVGDLVFDEDE